MDFLKKIKELFQNKNKKKLLENSAIVLIIGVVIIIAGKSFLGSNTKQVKNEAIGSKPKIEVLDNNTTNSDVTEVKLKNILSQIDGVGKVEVMITYSVSKENVPAYDTKKSESSTDEKDNGGGTRKIEQSNYDSAIVYENNQNGDKSPVIIKELQPVVKGVLVVAEGASEPAVKERICKAVQTLLDIPIHKVQVVERKK